MTDEKMPGDAGQADDAPAAVPAGSAKVKASTGVASSGSGPQEPPYIDDGVSKVWIGVIIAAFSLIFAWAVFFGSNGLLSGMFGSDAETSSPEPTLSMTASPEPSTEASMAPVAGSIEPSIEPTAEPTPEPTAVPTPEPTPELTAEPSLGPCITPDPFASLEPGESPAPTPACYSPVPSMAPSPTAGA